jgi:hypothetical protein
MLTPQTSPGPASAECHAKNLLTSLIQSVIRSGTRFVPGAPSTELEGTHGTGPYVLPSLSSHGP